MLELLPCALGEAVGVLSHQAEVHTFNCGGSSLPAFFLMYMYVTLYTCPCQLLWAWALLVFLTCISVPPAGEKGWYSLGPAESMGKNPLPALSKFVCGQHKSEIAFLVLWAASHSLRWAFQVLRNECEKLMTVFAFRRWLQGSSRLMQNSWPTCESRIWKSASNPCTLWTTPFWGRGNYSGNWAYSISSPWLVWLSQGSAHVLPLKRVETMGFSNSIRSWRYSVVNYLSEKSVALCLELIISWELGFGVSPCYYFSPKLLKHQAKGWCLYPWSWEWSRGFKCCLGKAPRRDRSVYSPPGW